MSLLRRRRRGVVALIDPELVEVMSVQDRSKVLVPALDRMAKEIGDALRALPEAKKETDG